MLDPNTNARQFAVRSLLWFGQLALGWLFFGIAVRVPRGS